MKYNSWYVLPDALASKIHLTKDNTVEDLNIKLAEITKGTSYKTDLGDYEQHYAKWAECLILCQDAKYGVCPYIDYWHLCLGTVQDFRKFLIETKELINNGTRPDYMDDEKWEEAELFFINPDANDQVGKPQAYFNELLEALKDFPPEFVVYFNND